MGWQFRSAMHIVFSERQIVRRNALKFRRDPQWDKTELREEIVSLESRDSSFGIIMLGWIVR